MARLRYELQSRACVTAAGWRHCRTVVAADHSRAVALANVGCDDVGTDALEHEHARADA